MLPKFQLIGQELSLVRSSSGGGQGGQMAPSSSVPYQQSALVPFNHDRILSLTLTELVFVYKLHQTLVRKYPYDRDL